MRPMMTEYLQSEPQPQGGSTSSRPTQHYQQNVLHHYNNQTMPSGNIGGGSNQTQDSSRQRQYKQVEEDNDNIHQTSQAHSKL